MTTVPFPARTDLVSDSLLVSCSLVAADECLEALVSESVPPAEACPEALVPESVPPAAERLSFFCFDHWIREPAAAQGDLRVP